MNEKHKKLSETIDAEAKAQAIIKKKKSEYGTNIYIKRKDIDDIIDDLVEWGE